MSATAEQQEAALRKYIRSLPAEAFDLDRLSIDSLPHPVPADVRARIEALPIGERKRLLWIVSTLANMSPDQLEACGIQTIDPTGVTEEGATPAARSSVTVSGDHPSVTGPAEAVR
jgi:hypothetical protein